jgi:hypothetical protein
MIIATDCPKCGARPGPVVARTTAWGDMPTEMVRCTSCGLAYWLPKAGFEPSYYSLQPEPVARRSFWQRLRAHGRALLAEWRGEP